MKTTIELPDALAESARQVALDEGTTLRTLVVDGLRAELERRQAKDVRNPFALHTVDGNGLRAGVDPARLAELAYEQ